MIENILKSVCYKTLQVVLNVRSSDHAMASNFVSDLVLLSELLSQFWNATLCIRGSGARAEGPINFGMVVLCLSWTAPQSIKSGWGNE